MNQQQNASNLPSISALLKEAWIIYKAKFKTLTGIMLFSFPLLVLVNVFISLKIIHLPLFATLIIVSIISFVVAAWSSLALLYAIKDGVGIREAYRKGWPKILSYWWLSFLSGFITSSGFLFLIIPGIIFSVWFAFANYILVAEDIKGMNALLKSKEYVAGRWMSVFYRFFFVNLVLWLPIFFGIISSSFFHVHLPTIVLNNRNYIFLFIGLFTGPFIWTYTFLIYNHLRKLKGEFAFAPTTRKKLPYLLIGIPGFSIFFFLIIILVISLFLHKPQSFRQTPLSTSSQNDFSSIFQKNESNDSLRKIYMKSMQTELKIYYDAHKAYPSDINELELWMQSNADLIKDNRLKNEIQNLYDKFFTELKTQSVYHYQVEKDGQDLQFCVTFTTKQVRCINSQSKLQ